MAQIGTISIDLVAHTGKLIAPLAKAGSAVKSFTSGIVGGKLGLGGLFAGLAAATGGALTFHAAFAAVKGQFEAVDDIAKSADRLGMSTEAFVGLSHGADLAGVSTEQLNTSMQFFLKKGHHADELGEIADKMAGMTSATDRMKLATDLFGKSGAGMINFLAGGSAGLEDAAADAQLLGLTLSRTDAGKIEMANDAMTRLGALFTGIARKVAIELAPFVKFAADQFVLLGTEGEGWGGKVRAAVDFVITGIGWVLDAVDFLRTAWEGLQLGPKIVFSFIATGIATVVNAIESGVEGMIEGFTWAWSQASQLATEGVGKMIKVVADAAAWLESLLPESMQLGLGDMAQEFSKTFDAVAQESRNTLENTDFSVDLHLGGQTATDFAKTLGEDTERATQEFLQFAGREKMSDKLRRNVEQIREDAQTAADEAASVAPADFGADTLGGKDAKEVLAGAIERGSQEAFAAFQSNTSNQKTAEQLLMDRQLRVLESIDKNTSNGLAMASL